MRSWGGEMRTLSVLSRRKTGRRMLPRVALEATRSRHALRDTVFRYKRSFCDDRVSMFNNIPQALTMLRKARDLSRAELATRADLSRAAISAYERGETQPTLQSLGKVLDALEVTELQFLAALRSSEGLPGGVSRRAMRSALPETLSTDAAAHLADALEHLGQFLRLAGLQLLPWSLPPAEPTTQTGQPAPERPDQP